MYFELVKTVLEGEITNYMNSYGLTRDEVLTKIRSCIDATSAQYRNPNPIIDYSDALCRLGYIYRHVGINATLFERTLNEDATMKCMIDAKIASGNLTIASLGGGPGTELLGLAKYLSQRIPQSPIKINFTVLDNVVQWVETWKQLAKAAEQKLEAQWGSNWLTTSPDFLGLDVLEPSSYSGFTTMFKDVDIIVCNYLFSENQTKLQVAGQAISQLAGIVGNDCTFVIIDRLEQNTNFVNDVIAQFQAIFSQIQKGEFAGKMDQDEQISVLGQDLINRLRYPRLKYRNADGSASVFWFTARK